MDEDLTSVAMGLFRRAVLLKHGLNLIEIIVHAFTVTLVSTNEASFLFVLVGVDADNLVIIVMMGSWTAADVDARDGTEHDG